MQTTIWSDADCAAIASRATSQPLAAIAADYGISRSAVSNRLYRWRQQRDTRPSAPRGARYLPHEIAVVLGCPYHSVRQWRTRGALRASVVRSAHERYSTVADIRAFLTAGHALCPSIQPPPTALFWRGEVERARTDLHRRWVSVSALQDALGIGWSLCSSWRRQDGFPLPVFRLGRYGQFLDRAAVIAWLTAHPARATRAGWRLLNDGT